MKAINKTYLIQTFVASSWPSAWQHFRQFCSREDSVRLKGFNSSHELQSKFTENPMSLHCSGVNSDSVNWINAKKMERKGDIQFVQSILHNSQATVEWSIGPRPLAVFPGIVWKNLNFDQHMGKENLGVHGSVYPSMWSFLDLCGFFVFVRM